MLKAVKIGRWLILAGILSIIITAGVSRAYAEENKAEKLIAKFTSGKKATSEDITLKIPKIADGDDAIPLTVSVESPMTKRQYIKRIIIIAPENHDPIIVTFNFTTLSGVAEASTRIRLDKPQDIIALAERSDGSFVITKQKVLISYGSHG